MTAPARTDLPGLCIDPATGVVSDPVVTPLLAALMQYAVDVYDSLPNVPTPCSWGILGGSQTAVERGGWTDTNCSGLLTVRMVSVTPADQFPANSAGPIRFFDLSYGINVELGVWRPSPEPTETGDGLVLPTLAEEQDAAERDNLDGAIVRAALLGYARDTDTPIVLGPTLPWGPEGGVVGTATTAQFQIV